MTGAYIIHSKIRRLIRLVELRLPLWRGIGKSEFRRQRCLATKVAEANAIRARKIDFSFIKKHPWQGFALEHMTTVRFTRALVMAVAEARQSDAGSRQVASLTLRPWPSGKRHSDRGGRFPCAKAEPDRGGGFQASG